MLFLKVADNGFGVDEGFLGVFSLLNEFTLLNLNNKNYMNAKEEKIFREKVSKDCDKMRNSAVTKWCELYLYLDKEKIEGKREFRIAFQDENHFIVHPLGKDGKTLDMLLED
jgi:hypothetical protein